MDFTTLPTAGSPAPGTTAPSAAPTASGSAIPNDFNTFLRMLTVQMQNQDPLNPIDSADYAVQLATFSGVEQQVRTNDILNGLSGQLALSGLAQMAGWVGQEARAPMPAWFDGAPVSISPNPLAAADKAELVVKDAQGREVARDEIAISSDPIEWAGVAEDGSPLAEGFYNFEVVSYSDGQPILTEPAELYATVAEVRTQDGKPVLVMAGGATVAADKVTALRAGI